MINRQKPVYNYFTKCHRNDRYFNSPNVTDMMTFQLHNVTEMMTFQLHNVTEIMTFQFIHNVTEIMTFQLHNVRNYVNSFHTMS